MIEPTSTSRVSESECESLVELLRHRQNHRPNRLAYQFLVDGQSEGARLTYRQLFDQAAAIARRLREVIDRGERVLLLYPPGCEFLPAFFGCLKAGGIAVPLPPPDAVRIKHALPRLESVIRDAKAAAVLTTTTIEEGLRGHLQGANDIPELVWINTEAVLTDRDEPITELRIPDPSPDDIALLQYTSGSTSAPKGVMVSHRNIIHQCRSLQSSVGYDDQSVTCTWMPYHHDYGLIEGLILPLVAGVPCYFMSPLAFIKRPHRWLAAISRYGVTHSQAPHFAYELCVRKVNPNQRRELDLRKWKIAAVGAEPIRMETLDAFFEMLEPCGFRREALTPAYGLAESTLAVSYTPPGEGPTCFAARPDAYQQGNLIDGGNITEVRSAVQAVVSCGEPIDDTTIEIVNPDTNVACRVGEVGEIWVSSPSVAMGYWNRPRETKEVFDAHIAGDSQRSFLRTGDLGCLIEGRLYVTGRNKDLIIVRGLNHYPHDIERTVETSHSALRAGNGAAFSVEVGGQEKLVVVYEIQGKCLRGLDAQAVCSAIREAVYDQHRLQMHAIALWKPGAVPKTTSGKIQRRKTKAAFLAGSVDRVGYWQADRQHAAVDTATSTRALEPARQRMIQQLADLTGVDAATVDPNAKFSTLGIDSLRAAELADDLESWIGRRIEPTIFWEQTTINELAESLFGRTSTQNADLSSQRSAKVQSMHAGRKDPEQPVDAIAIVGMGCRFPGGVHSPEQFWRLLCTGGDAVGKIPEDRWRVEDFFDADRRAAGKMYVRHGAFVENADQFDAGFFGISPREAEVLDPQQRLLLEVTWESLENAGIAPSGLRGSETGVFVGLSSDDFAEGFHAPDEVSEFDVYQTLGTARSIAAGRVAYVLGLHGPVIQIDTACSSSLVAIYQACQSLQAGECDLAVAGGVNLMLSPATMVALCKLTALAADGRSKTFDADADGYGRGEGCGMVTLKRQQDAIRDGDTILANIRGAAINHDGASNGLIAPNGQAQRRLLRKAIEKARVDAAQVGFVEAHGTGTELGDPIELAAIDAAYNRTRVLDQPLFVGSVKASIGHLEAAAGVAGLMKVVLMLRHGQIPPQPHFNRPNPHLQWDRLALDVAKDLKPWPDEEYPRIAAVSSFGFSGTNSHLILESGNTASPRDRAVVARATPPLHLLPLSAKCRTSLVSLADKYIKHLNTHPDQTIDDVCFTAATARDHFKHRIAIVASSRDELSSRLREFVAGRNNPYVVQADAIDGSVGSVREIAFLFTGQGTQYRKMGQDLYRDQPVFREALNRCSELVHGHLDRPLAKLLYGADDPMHDHLDPILNAQTSLFALQFALVELWKSWGIRPSAVMGHSLGEYAAACTAQVMDMETTLQLVAARSRLLDELPKTGCMAVVMAKEAAVREAIDLLAARISIAAINGPDNVVISGEHDAVEQVLNTMSAAGIDCEKLQASAAGHSFLIEPMLEAFREVAETFHFQSPQITMVSNVSGKLAGEEVACATYWTSHLRQCVRFADGMRTLAHGGCRTFIEIGPNPNLLAMGMGCVEKLRPRPRWLPSLARQRSSWETILCSLAQLYVDGATIDWPGFHRPYHRRRVELPTYAFQGNSYPLHLTRAFDPVCRVAGSDLPAPAVVAAKIKHLTVGLEDESRALTPQLDQAAIRFVVDALEQLGFAWVKGAEFRQRELFAKIPAANHPKVARVLQRVTERDLLSFDGHRYRVQTTKPQVDPLSILDQVPAGEGVPECILMRRAGRSLAAIWKQQLDPLSMLFPDGSIDQAASFYQHSKLLHGYNLLAAAAVQEAIMQLPRDAKLRVLEVGAGTGGLTNFLLPLFPAERSEYVFTDLSPLFLNAARERFSQFDSLTTRMLDIGQPPEPQGFKPQSFDLVVAANVLHATPSVRESLRHVQRLLKPSGWLMLLEGANPPLWGDMVFTLMDGWWNFEDKELRPDYPLMRRARWSHLLARSHFEKTAFLHDAKLRDESQHTLFLAQTASTQHFWTTKRTEPTSNEIEQPTYLEARKQSEPNSLQTDSCSEELSVRIGPVGEALMPTGVRERVREHAARVMRLNPGDIDFAQPLCELGLDSLMATELKARLTKTFGRELTLNTLQMRRSIDEITAYIGHDPEVQRHAGELINDNPTEILEVDAPRAQLVPLQPYGDGTPLFFVPAGYGDLFAFQQISYAIGTSQPVYGLQPASAKRLKTFRQMSIHRLASAYIAEIKKVQPRGPYWLSGYSAGAIIAVEVARELKRQGEKIGLLVIFDPPSHVPGWLDDFYQMTYRVTAATGLIDVVSRIRSRFVRRMFHAVLDEGLRTHTSVTRRHRVAPYPGRITHFRAQLSQSSLVSLRPVGRFWSRTAREGIEVHWIPGTHYGVLRGAAAITVVDELRDCLQRAACNDAGKTSQQREQTS